MPKTLPVTSLLRLLLLLFFFLFVSNGVLHAQTPVPYSVDNSATDYTLVKAVGLPGGKSATIYRDNSYNYKCSIVGSDGIVSSNFDFTSKMMLQNTPDRIEVNVLGTSSGNIWITYTSPTSDGPPNTINAKYLVLDQSGNQVYSGTVNGSNLGTVLNRYIYMDQLSNGNVVMVWLASDNMSGACRIFNANGTPATSDVSFAGPASTIFPTTNTHPILWGNRVAANPNGGFLITFFYSSGNFQGILFDNNGTVQQVGGSNAFNIDPAFAGSYTNISAQGLSNGNYMVAWSENSSGTNTGYYKIISSTGSTIKAQTTLPANLQTDIGNYSWVGAAANHTSSSPGFVVADYSWQNYDDWTNPYAKVVYYNFDQNGNYLSSTDASSYFIADFNGPTVSVYSGNPSGVGVVYANYKNYTPNGSGYTTSGLDISGTMYGMGGASLSTNADLSNLTLNSGTLSPAFASGTTTYTASVSNSTSSITVTPTVAESHATVTVNGTSVTSGSASGSIPLNVGANTITIKLTAQDGVTTKTYTVTVSRAASSNAGLSSLIVGGATLSPVFASGTTAYTGSVSNATASVEVIPTLAESSATVTVNNIPVTSGSSSGPVSLAVGSNTITVRVTAGDGVTTSSYTITITRAASPSISYTGSFSGLSTTYGTPSTASSIAVSGADLSAGITAAVSPAAFELSSDGVNFTSSVTIGSSGTVSGTLYVRLKSSAAAGAFSTGSVSLSSTGANNPTIAVPSSTINKASLTITANDGSKVYGASVPTLTASYTGFVNGDNASSLTTEPTLGTVATAASAVGNYAITASGAAASNYTITYVAGSLAVTRAPLTITANSVNKTYGQTLTGGTGSSAFTQIGLVNGESIGSVTIAYGTGAAATDAVGTYTNQVIPSAAVGGTFNSANYSITYTKGDITTSPAASTISFAALPAKTYGDANFDAGARSTNATVAITYTSSNTAVATIVSGKVHIVGAGTTIITASQAADANHSQAADQQQTLTVNKARLTAIADDQTKLYGQSNPVLTVHYNGFIGTDNASKLATQATASTTALTSSPVGTYTITVSGGTADNYIVNSYQNASLVITPAALTITANDQSKVYGSSVPTLTVSCSGFVNGDNASSLTTAPILSTTATAASAVGNYTINASGATAQNYSISYVAGNLAVTPAALTVIADDKTKVYGAVMPTLTVSYNGFVNGDNASGLSSQPVITTSATSSSGVGTYTITASGAASANYTISYVSGTLTVNAAQPVISFGPLPVKTYGDADFDGGATSDNVSTGVTYSSDNTAVVTIVSGKIHVVGAGTANITASQAADANHTAAADVLQHLTVNKKAITVNADAKSKTYGESDPALTYQITSGALVGTDSFSGSLGRDAGENAGSYVIGRGTLALSDNYTLTYNNSSLTINKAAVTVTADAKTKIYGESDPALTYQLTSGSLVGTDAFSGGLARNGGENTGTYAINQGTLALSNNYTLTFNGASLTINRAALTITAENKSKVYGAANPTLTASYSGFVNGDNASSLTTAPMLTTAVTTASPVGNYAITASGVVSSNYTISYIAGNLSVTQATLTITADNQTKVYGQNNPALTVSYSGFVNGDDQSKLTAPAVAATLANTNSGSGSYDITVSGAACPDYAIVYKSGTLTVTTAVLTVIADDKVRVYGATNPALTVSYSGFVNGDGVSSLGAQATAATTATTGSGVGNYPVIPSGGASDNYSFNYVNGNLSITPKRIVINADQQTKVYGQADPALTYSVSGLVGSDDLTGSLARTSGENVGAYSIEQGSLEASNNYVVTYQGADLSITPKPITVSADAMAKTYGDPDPAFTYSISPALVNGDALNGALTRAAGEDAGTYAIDQGSLDNSNYAISFTGNIFTINKAPQHITWAQTLSMGCDQVKRTTLTATASSGLPVTYSSADTSIASIEGTDVVMTGRGTVILTASQAGNQNYLPATPVSNTLINKLPAALVVKRWDDVLVFDNSSNQYKQWQWYKNGTAIPGATGQYYYESGKLNGVYLAEAITKTGVTQQTCPVSVTPGTSIIPIAVYPNPVTPGQTVQVTTGYSSTDLQGATLTMSNVMGVVVQTVQKVTPQTNVNMPFAQGIYVIRLHLANGVTASLNVLVKPQ